MPTKPKRGCAYGSCPKLAMYGRQYCKEHQKLMNSQYDRYERDPEVVKKYGGSWKKIRKQYALEHPYCERCFREGRMTLVDEVHHIIPLSRGGDHTSDNLMSLCRSCHNKVHRELGDR